LTAKDRIWAMGVALLGDKGRAYIGKTVATYGEEAVLDVLAEATRERPIDARAWIVAACEARAKAKPARANWKHPEPPNVLDLLARDPTPDWALAAGFPDIFHAESHGCGPGNFRKFRDGRRIEA
jgi:hypothetical protein